MPTIPATPIACALDLLECYAGEIDALAKSHLDLLRAAILQDPEAAAGMLWQLFPALFIHNLHAAIPNSLSKDEVEQRIFGLLILALMRWRYLHFLGDTLNLPKTVIDYRVALDPSEESS